MRRGAPEELMVEVMASSDLDFRYSLLTTGAGGFGLYPLSGRPIAGLNFSWENNV